MSKKQGHGRNWDQADQIERIHEGDANKSRGSKLSWQSVSLPKR